MDRRHRVALAVVVLAATALRLGLAAALPLVDDEAYYWAWVQHLAAGYPDHPPAIAWLISPTTALLGDTPLGGRVGAVVLSGGISLVLFDLGRMMFNPMAGAIAAIGYQLIPAFTVGSIFAFPDAPFVFFWALALWALWRARTHARGWDWYLAGLAAGLAAASKLNAAFLAISMVGFLLWTPSERPWRRRVEPYRAAAIALLVFLPFIAWNAAHDWMTFQRLHDPALWVETGVPALNAAAFIAAQLAYYGPLTAPLLIAALAALGTDARRRDTRSMFLLWSALPILALTWLASFDGIPKPHWHAPGFLMGLIAAGAAWDRIRTRRSWQVAVGAAVALNLAVVGVLVALPFRPDFAGAGHIWGWDQVAARTEPLFQATPASPGRFIMMARYQTAGQMEFPLRPKHLVATPFGGDAYALWVPHQAVIDWNALYINDSSAGPGAPLDRMFQRVDRLPDIEVVRYGRVIRRFAVYRGFGFRGMPIPPVRPR